MNAPGSRRGFLRGLTTLPLIGGGVTLIGTPTAVAAPITPDLLGTYDTWLFYERRFLRFERYGPRAAGTDLGYDERFAIMDKATGKGFDWVMTANGAGPYHNNALPPSTRAALVLSAVDCNPREQG